ncbi:copper resistance protein CopC [Deinococcus proteolyticus MRP]|uniref:Copper resistance protein CopC n=1 Tax=Deinococcus proteolyticus (strain ATCC 35074 / DSM 20540 / JCM 6276 / NBRC 101906 / NCIMB 13154 / VKM Ac-1939 / CCM 2703 / MRP) TaxID=693977 RepID=F0RMV3_DEIPM|nr:MULTISPECIES: copper resistance protein CopC [Deinococcus]ADY26095.1 copper resistance protein CopC [Deinococcus proteolyticus MRP]MCY1702215.1 copper resistance protein CopC [Deinococcus sp. SL84]
MNIRPALALLAALSLPLAAAHTAVTDMQPAANSVVAAPASVTLHFSESVNLRYSIFKVYPLPVGQSGQRAAAELTRRVITLRGDEAARADRYRPRSGYSQGVTVPLKGGLKPGRYAVMWRLMSADGHPVTGQSVFTVR